MKPLLVAAGTRAPTHASPVTSRRVLRTSRASPLLLVKIGLPLLSRKSVSIVESVSARLDVPAKGLGVAVGEAVGVGDGVGVGEGEGLGVGDGVGVGVGVGRGEGTAFGSQPVSMKKYTGTLGIGFPLPSNTVAITWAELEFVMRLGSARR